MDSDTPPNGYNAGDELLVAAIVKIINDGNGNGRWDAGETILASDESDGNGFYIIPPIAPGKRIMAVVPAEVGQVWGDPVPFDLPTDTFGSAAALDVPYVAGTLVDLTGIIWNDVDGDEIVEDGEPRLGNVRVEVYGAVSGQTTGDPPLASATTQADGAYRVSGLLAGWPYEVRPVAAMLPPGWIMSSDPTTLLPTPTARWAECGGRGLLQPVGSRAAAPERLEEGAQASGQAALHARAGRWVHRHRRGIFGRLRRGGGHPRGPDAVTRER